ncbi:MAG: matrixin family metalloprotease [Deltaproteobacteria bacterium]|nr:matrixin family metalloprotease [Deltaproteobacteria bacterium]
MVVALGAAGVSAPAAAFVRAAVDGKPNVFLYWPARRLTYYVHEKGSGDVPLRETLGAVKRSFYAWASPSCTDITFDFGGTTPLNRTNISLGKGEKPDMKNVLVWREERWPPTGVTDASVTTEMAAITILIYNNDTGELVDADMDLNGYNFFWSSTEDKTKITTDIQNVVTHEVGHILGLGHVDDDKATMYTKTPQGETDKRSLEADDVAGVCFVYPFAGTTPTGKGQQVPSIDVQGGCAVGGQAPPWGMLLALFALLSLLGVGLRRLARLGA